MIWQIYKKLQQIQSLFRLIWSTVTHYHHYDADKGKQCLEQKGYYAEADFEKCLHSLIILNIILKTCEAMDI